MRRFAAVLLWLAVAGTAASAQDWPNRPVRIIVPFGAGGTGDAVGRIVAEHLSAALKQQFVVENRVGAGGMIGVQAVAAAAPDGYTLGITNVSTLALIPLISAKVSYRPLEDFTHVAYAAGAPVALAVTPGAGVTTLAEFVAHAGRSERPLTFASSGVGSDGHLIGEAIGAAMKVRIEHVPYRNTSQALMDVVAGHVVFSTFTLSSTAQFLRQGTLKGIAVTAPERMPDYPDLPTFRELGHPELVSSTWFSLSGPAGLPAEIVATLNRAVNEAMVRPEVQARLRRDGLLAQPMGAADFTRFVAAEGARWRPLIERAGLVGKGE